MEKEKRKVEYNYNCGKYEVLKPKNGNGWFDIGEKKTVHGLDELLKKDEFEFVISEDVKKKIEQYRQVRKEKYRMLSSQN
jgi:hypothetical protein